MTNKVSFTGWETVNGKTKPVTKPIKASEKKTEKVTAISAITNYRDAYMKAAEEITATRENTELKPEAVEARINKIGETLAADAEKYRAAAVEALETLKADYHKARKTAIENGLAAADEIGLITANIKNGVFDADMLAYCLEIYADNPIALESIGGALGASDKENLRLMAADIPADKTAATISGIDKVISNIENVPMLNAPTDNLTGAMWRNGQSFDSLIDYLSELGA